MAFSSLVLLVLAAGRQQPPAPDASGEYDGTPLSTPAAEFRLMDQTGAAIALSDYRQQIVALTFMGSRCHDVCPLTAIQLRRAYQALGDQASSVAFIGINVNLKANQIADVKAATELWQLNEIPSWHFLTGSVDELEPMWQAYGVAAIPAPGGEAITHTPGVYLIDQSGQVRWYISTPYEEASTSQWTLPLSELLVKHIRELLSEG